LGRALRRLGWSYGEIREVIPVPKGTLSSWCRQVRLDADQVAALKARGASAPRDTGRRRRLEIEALRSHASLVGRSLADDPFWTAGVALYWAEGSKTSRRLQLSNADPAALRLFIAWAGEYLHPSPMWILSLHLHEGNDDDQAKRFWREELRLPYADFTKTYIKARGTGHRKNTLQWGVCRATLRRSTDAWIRTMEWIEVLGTRFGP